MSDESTSADARSVRSPEADEEAFPDLNSEESAALLDSLVQEHAERTAERVLKRLGGPLTPATLGQYLSDDVCLRYPTTIVFDESGLEPNQFGEPVMADEDGQRVCRIRIHPRFEQTPDLIPYFVAYLSPVMNYGLIVSSDVCEWFGAEITGVERDDYYAILCRAIDGG